MNEIELMVKEYINTTTPEKKNEVFDCLDRVMEREEVNMFYFMMAGIMAAYIVDQSEGKLSKEYALEVIGTFMDVANTKS